MQIKFNFCILTKHNITFVKMITDKLKEFKWKMKKKHKRQNLTKAS
jgi:hypothetical protein